MQSFITPASIDSKWLHSYTKHRKRLNISPFEGSLVIHRLHERVKSTK